MPFKENDMIELVYPIPELELQSGTIGKLALLLSPGAWEVEFSNDERGGTAMVTLYEGQFRRKE